MIKVSSADITTTSIFIDYELNEFSEKLEKNIPIDELFKGALEECPKIDNVFVIFTYQGKIYSNSEIYPKELQLKDQDEIQNIGFYDYQSLHRTIYILSLIHIFFAVLSLITNNCSFDFSLPAHSFSFSVSGLEFFSSSITSSFS